MTIRGRHRSFRGVSAIARARSLALLLAAAACTAPGREIPYASARPLPVVYGRVVTNLDLLASGREIVDEYVAALPEPHRGRLRAVIARGKLATAGVHARFAIDAAGTSYQEQQGTGVFVAGTDGAPWVITAGHTFVNAGPERAVRVSTRAGRELPGELVACSYDSERQVPDFAAIRCAVAPPPGVVVATCAAPREGELVVALGYPDRFGVDDAGRLRRLDPGAALPEPLALLLEVVQVEPLMLVPVAGALPLGGFSGGGFFDADGNVVGVLTGVRHTWEPGGAAETWHVIGCSVAAMQALR
jgi:S1-C subfamily serine protease